MRRAGDKGGERRLVDFQESAELPPSEQVELSDDLVLLQEAVLELPHDLRVCVLLHHYDAMSYRDIAEVVKCSARGVETRLYRARKLLKRRLAQRFDPVDEDEKKKIARSEVETGLRSCLGG